MTSYDKRMEESEEKLKARFEDFEAERKDAELAFKVYIRIWFETICWMIVNISSYDISKYQWPIFHRSMWNVG